MNLCACMGAMYGEPYCPCEMKRQGRQDEMDNNPLRIADNKRFEEQMRQFFEAGGWERFNSND